MKRGTPDHWKMKDLAGRLKIPVPYAVGIMEMLWHYTAKYHPRGDIGSAPDWAIADAAGWNCGRRRDRVGQDSGKLAAFIDALVVSRWLDRDKTYRIIVHDWPDHADESVKRLLKEKGLSFVSPTPNQFDSGLPLPSLAFPKPSQAKPEPAVAVGEGEYLEWWCVWSEVRGTHHENEAARAYISVAGGFGAEVLECTRSYLASLDNPAKGFNPDNFLFEQAKQKFKARWPAFTSRVFPKKETASEGVLSLMKKRIGDGRSPL